MTKQEIAEIFEEIALLLEMKGENPFRVRAYRNAARSLLNTERELKELIEKGELTALEGIGEDLAEKITKLAKTGRLPFYEKLKRSVPKGILELREVPGLGAKRIKTLYEKLKIHSIEKLKKACETGKVAKLTGFGKRMEQKILQALGAREVYAKRHLWWNAIQIAEPIVEGLRQLKGVSRAEIAGSVRRGLETVGDLDFVVASSQPKIAISWFTSQKMVIEVLAKGDTKGSVLLEGGIQADLRVVSPEEFGFAWLYFTGSKEHNLKLRERARKKKWSLSEYGLAGARMTGKREEKEIYAAFGLPYIPPELRENRGEFKAKMPRLIEVADIRGTLHNHTTASDGRSTLREMVEAAEKMGWDYIGISDHSKSSVQANGLSEERLAEQIEVIKNLNHSKKGIYVFSGTECDILANGELDFSDDILKKLDFVIVSVHSSLTQDEAAMTKRIIRAVEHPLSTMVGHVTGRLLLRREGYRVNVPKVIDACIANNKIIELNGNPNRLDMDWRFWKEARDRGLRCCINTDAHHAAHHQFIRAGINSAKKGWLQKEDVINTLSLSNMKKFLAKTNR